MEMKWSCFFLLVAFEKVSTVEYSDSSNFVYFAISIKFITKENKSSFFHVLPSRRLDSPFVYICLLVFFFCEYLHELDIGQ